MTVIKNFVLATLLLIAFKGFSQTVTNVSDKVDNILSAHGLVNVTKNSTTTVVVCTGSGGNRNGGGDRVCHNEQRTVRATTQEYLKATRIRTIKVSDFEFGDDNVISLPGKFLETGQNLINTSAIPSSQSLTLSLTFTRSTAIAFTQTISHTSQVSGNFSLKITDGFTVGGNVQVGENETHGNATTTTDQATVTRSATVQANLPPKSAVRASLRLYTVRHQVKFKCLVTIDADITPNDAGVTLLSQMADEQSRTFEIDGIITADDCTDGETTQSDAIKLTNQQLKNLFSASTLKFK